MISLAYYGLFPFKEILSGLPRITSFHVTGAFLGPILILFLFVISASGWGVVFWHKHHLFYFEKILFSTACGIGILSLIILFADFIGVTGNVFYFAVLIIGFLIFLSAAGSIHEHVISHFKPWMLIAVIPILSSLLGALAPPTQYDSLAYHLAIPKLYLENNKIFLVPNNLYFSFPQNMEMLYQAALSVDGDILANLIHWVFLTLTSLLLFTFCKRYLNRKTAILSSVIWFFTPITLFLSTGTYVDLGLAFFIFMSFYNIMLFKESKHDFWLYSAGFFAGISLGIKYTAVIPVAILILLFVYNSKDMKVSLLNVIKYLLVAFVIFVPWLIKNSIFLKNPIAPWGSSLFTGSLISSDDAVRYFYHIKQHGFTINGISDLLLMPWKVTAYGFNFGGGFDILGPVFLLFAPFILLKLKITGALKAGTEESFKSTISRRGWMFIKLPVLYRSRLLIVSKVVFIVLFFSICYCLIWLATGKVLRFLVPVLPFLCILTAAGLASLSWNKWLSRAAYLFFITALLHNILLFHWVISDIDPYATVIGKETRDEYLTRKLNSYKAINEAVNSLPSDAKILNWGETRSYYFQRKNITPLYFDKNPLIEWMNLSADENELAGNLKNNGVTHIMINSYEVQRLGYENRLTPKNKEVFEAYKKHFMSLIYEDKYCQVYKIT